MLRSVETGSGIDPLELFTSDRRSVHGRPWVMLNMISSIDGGTAVEGRSTALGDDDDRDVFAAIRAVPDVILVGASTVKAEDYGPVTLDDERVRRRKEAGLEPTPRLVIVTGRLSLDPAARVFSDPNHQPMILTSTTVEGEKVAAFSEVAEVVQSEHLDANGIVGHLRSAKVVLCEGGPSLNGQLAAANLIDEVNLTMAPVLVSGDSSRIARGDPASPPANMRLDRALQGDRSVFLRYVRA